MCECTVVELVQSHSEFVSAAACLMAALGMADTCRAGCMFKTLIALRQTECMGGGGDSIAVKVARALQGACSWIGENIRRACIVFPMSAACGVPIRA